MRTMTMKKRAVCSFALLLCVLVLWLMVYRGGWARGLRLKGDAISYFESFSFLVQSLSAGSYPLWNPAYGQGVPNTFFLRRIGEFNPFYIILFVLVQCGLRFEAGYFVFMVSYLFLGLGGFYGIIYRLYRQEKYALIGTLLLTFSSFGSILFQSFIILIFTPAVWFFYFLISFYQQQNRLNFVGALCCLLIICTTYIPFYFLTIFIFFLLFWTVLYLRRLILFFSVVRAFIKKERRLVFVAGVSLFLALGPGLLVFQQAQSGLFVLPLRHHLAAQDNALSVRHQTTAVGGIPHMEVIKEGLWDFKQMQVGTIYIPVWILVLLLLAGWIRLNARIVLYVVWAATIYLLSIYDASFLYPFLFKYVFFFKLFRNFQFFIWVFLLPVVILLGVEHLVVFEKVQAEGRQRRNKRVYLALVHGGLLISFIFFQHREPSSYLVILLSLVYFFVQESGRQQTKAVLYSIVLVLIILQPLAASRFLSASMLALPRAKASYDLPDTFPYYTASYLTNPAIKAPPVYIGTVWYDRLRQALPYATVKKYLQYKFVVYDQTAQIRLTPQTRPVILSALDEFENIAFINEPDQRSFVEQSIKVPPLLITQASAQLRVLRFQPNSIEIQTDFPQEKFLVYNDCYYPGWQADIDGRSVPLYRSNTAFKGIWVPPGPHRVRFTFGRPIVYFYYAGMFVLLYGWFCYGAGLIFLPGKKGIHGD